MAELPLPARFEIVRRLGEGGMGIVYEALDVERGVRVALKTIRDPDADALARFKREFRALQDVNHPNLVTLGELVSYADHWFFTMELVEGDEIVRYVRPAEASVAIDPIAPTANVPLVAAGGGSPARRTTPRPVSSVRRPRAFDEARLRSTMRQLASAIAAMHEAGMVHRDIKPSNVRVDRDGRAVLIDFGLVLDLRADAALSATRLAGTPLYMAPEQATTHAVGPEADWYAFGVLLYEELTGVLPFDGAPLEILMNKQKGEPPPPSAVAADVPADLETLCMELLRFDPKARPKGHDVLRALGASDDEAPKLRSHTEEAPFVGRSAELAALRDALVVARGGVAATVVVRGESGVGKSCLVRRFVDSCALEDGELVVLAGRCYEREAVPYKAFDGVVDAMTRLLLRLPTKEVAALFPSRTEALADVFPVLGRLPNFRKPAFARATIDPHELRARAFAALREMLTRLSMRHPVIALIDDVQWADEDSLALLAELMRPPDAPPLLLVATMRVVADAARDAETRARLAAALPGDARTIDVKRLTADEARNLARLLLARSTTATPAGQESGAASIADGAEGHPLFIDALVHHHATLGDAAGPILLDEALWSHAVALGDAARLLVELLAVAASPLKQEVLLAAAGDEHAEDFSKLVAMLRVAHLVSISGGRTVDAIELYHDRVRTAVLAHVDPRGAARHHRALALALERVGSSDAEALAMHWRGAGDGRAAARYAEAAGDAASNALAFDRAAQWYGAALELGAPEGDAGRALNVRLGDALANAGRGARAAAAYRRAAEGAPAANKLDLQRRAADQLLRGGHFEDGLQALAAVLATIGMKLPATPWLALLSLLWWRAWIRLRGLGFTRRDSTEIAASELTKVDTCWSVSFGLAMVDNIRGASFQARHLALALATGEVRRIHRALSIEIPYVARGGARAEKQVDLLIERTEQLTMEIGEPYALGFRFTALALGQQLLGRFRAALEASDSAEVFLRDCAGNAWELANARAFAIMALSRLGAMKELCKRQPIYVRDAVERGDVYAAVHFRVGHASMRWIAEDDVERGRAEAKDAMAVWAGRTFQTEHYYELFADVHFDLYSGDAGRAYERIGATWTPMRRSLLLLVQAARVQARQLRLHAAIALALEQKEPTALLVTAERDARAQEREAVPWAVALAKLSRAGIEAARAKGRGDERVVRLLREAIAGLQAADLSLYAASARRALGGILGGQEGRAMVLAADEWMRAETIVSPEKMARLMAPGFAR